MQEGGEGGFLETKAETRFSDYSLHGVLHFSKPLMYFEKARFTVAEVSGIMAALKKARPDTEFSFVVIRARLKVRKRVVLPPGSVDRELRVRTWLKPASLCRMTFRQMLIDAQDGRELVEGTIDVVILANGEVLRQFPQEVVDCLKDYEKSIRECEARI